MTCTNDSNSVNHRISSKLCWFKLEFLAIMKVPFLGLYILNSRVLVHLLAEFMYVQLHSPHLVSDIIIPPVSSMKHTGSSSESKGGAGLSVYHDNKLYVGMEDGVDVISQGKSSPLSTLYGYVESITVCNQRLSSYILENNDQWSVSEYQLDVEHNQIHVNMKRIGANATSNSTIVSNVIYETSRNKNAIIR